MKQLELLWQLQSCDLKLQAMKKEEKLLNEATEITELSVKLKKNEYDLSHKKTQLDVDHEKIQRCNHKLKQINFNLKEVDEQLYGGMIHNIEKLQHLQQRNGELKEEAKAIEDDILNLMEIIEKSEKDVQNLENQYRQLMALYKEKKADHQDKQGSIGYDIKDVENARVEIEKALDHDVLKKYNGLIKKSKKAVVEVQGEQCEGCHMNIPLSLISQLKQGKAIVYCENCGRILYIEKNI